MELRIRYRLIKIDERYDAIQSIGYFPDGYLAEDQNFDMLNAENWRYDKNIQAWVEGEIDEETEEWKIKTD